MTRLGLISAVLASQAAGCVIYDDGYYDPGTSGAAITARWSFQDQATQKETGCPAGFATVALHSVAIDPATGDRVGADFVDLFDCSAGIGTQFDLPPDRYSSFIEVTDDRGTSVYAQGLSADIDVVDRDATFDTTILNDGGYFSLSWDLVGQTSNKSLDCDQLDGLSGIEAISTSVASSTNVVSDQFSCGDHFGVTGGLLQGAYTVSIAAVRGDASIGTAKALANKTIRARNAVTDLGHVLIPIEGK